MPLTPYLYTLFQSQLAYPISDKINMIEIFGDYSDDLPPSEEYLTLVFSPSAYPPDQRWGQNGISADFLADYFSTFFPSSPDPDTGLDPKSEVKGAVGYIANELLENAMKFHDDVFPHQISVALQLHREKLVFVATNSVNPEQAKKFQGFIKALLSSDPSEMYIHQLERNAEEEGGNDSGLGFLTMISDYMAKLGWKFETPPEEPGMVIVTTMVQLGV